MSPEQMEAFHARVKKAQPQFEDFRQKLEHEAAALAALAKQERVDEATLIAQLDKVLDAEREVKHVQMGLLAAIKNLLTPEQQARLREMTKGGGAKQSEDMRQRLTAKVERVQAGVRKWAESGRDPSEIAKTMQEKFKPLMDAGKVIEAEAELDRILETLK
jgi:Spy/CpxP family protein refolding chaperone